MSIGLVGRKCGMSRLFTEDGRSIPVTLIEATPNRVTQLKTEDNDGYSAVQVAAGVKRATFATSKFRNATRNASRYFSISSHDRPAWLISSAKRSSNAASLSSGNPYSVSW